MKKSNSIDMFGLSGDPSEVDRLEKLLPHLASDELDTPAAGSSTACLPLMITIIASRYAPDVFSGSLVRPRSQAHAQVLHFINC